jgi:hypothetical protein
MMFCGTTKEVVKVTRLVSEVISGNQFKRTLSPCSLTAINSWTLHEA